MPTPAPLLKLLKARTEDDPFRFSVDYLYHEACQGLRRWGPLEPYWFPWHDLPGCRWADGREVDPDIIRWWVVAAWLQVKPEGTPLLRKYLAQLDRPSREGLGMFLLTVYLRPDEGRREEQGLAPGGNGLPDYSSCRDVRWQSFGARGILALASGAPAVAMVARVRSYFRAFGDRFMHLKALLLLLEACDTVPATQFLLGVAQGNRMGTVEATAREIVDRLAVAQAWTPDQLLDRIIPWGGLDAQGVLVLSFGARTFTATLDPMLKLHLQDARGVPLKGLPQPNRKDDPKQVQEARGSLADCRRIIAQVRGIWLRRFFEAMCVRQGWTVGVWRQFLLGHPIVGRMAQRLVWMDDAGRLFRPHADGRVVDAHGLEVVPGAGEVRLAHGALIPPAAAGDWLAHGQEQGVSWLFDQLARPAPDLLKAASATELADRRGWMVDSQAFFGALKAREYRRWEDGGGGLFTSMARTFEAAGIRVVIGFTGCWLPTAGQEAALTTLTFTSMQSYELMDLRSVPPVIRSEGYADYLTVARQGTGYALDWEQRGEAALYGPPED